MELFWIGTFFVFGLCVGSFCNVLIYRMPRGESINFPASHCPKCAHPLKFYHNIPLFSWAFLRGRCAFCGEKISVRYPLVELSGGALGALALWLADFELTKAAFLGLALLLLLSLSLIDFEFHAVPEIPLLCVYFLALAFKFESVSEFFMSANSPLVVSLVFAGGITMIKSIASAWINRNRGGETLDSMGDADTIVIAAIGAILGGLMGVACVFIAGILQIILHIIMRKNSEEAPFIPALSLSLLLCLVLEPQIRGVLDAYFELVSVK